MQEDTNNSDVLKYAQVKKDAQEVDDELEKAREIFESMSA